jgi:hypothetical protein
MGVFAEKKMRFNGSKIGRRGYPDACRKAKKEMLDNRPSLPRGNSTQ